MQFPIPTAPPANVPQPISFTPFQEARVPGLTAIQAFNVKDIGGAVCDSIADDTAAIQKTIDLAPAGSVVLVPGRPRCTAPLQITKPITLMAWDNRNSNLPGTDSVGTIFFSADVAQGINATANVCIKSLIISGLGLGVSTGYGVNATTASVVLVDSVIQAFFIGLHVSQGYYNKLARTRVEYCTVAAQFDNCYNIEASQCAFNGRTIANATGIQLLNGSSMTMLGGSIESFKLAGAYLFGGSSLSLFGVYIEGTPDLADVGRAVILTDRCSVSAIGCHVYLTVNNKQFIGVDGGGTVGVRVYSRNNRIVYPTDASSVQVYSPALDATSFWDVAGDNWQIDAGIGCQYVNAGFANTVPAIGFGQYSFVYPSDYPDNLHSIFTLAPPLATAIPVVASAASITLPRGRRYVQITGAVNISSISAANMQEFPVTLIFTGAPTVVDGSNLKLNGNFVATADDTLTLITDGTNWYEIARSAN